MEFDPLEVRESGFELLPADADLSQSFVHEVPVGRRGDGEESVGLGLKGGNAPRVRTPQGLGCSTRRSAQVAVCSYSGYILAKRVSVIWPTSHDMTESEPGSSS